MADSWVDQNRVNGMNKNFFTRPINPWLIVLGCALVNMFAAGLFAVYAVNIFLSQAVREFGWPASSTSLFLTAFFLASGLGLLLLGYLISLYGTRRPSILLTIAYGFSLLFLIVAPPSEALFILIFVLIGLFGAPVSAMPFSIAISGFIDRKRGLAFGLGAAGAGAGSAAIPGISSFLLNEVGWRNGILIFAVFSTSLALFSMTFLLRTPPGAVTGKRSGETKSAPAYRFRDLIDRVMVTILVILTLNALCTIGALGNLVSVLNERGVSTTMAAGMLSAAGAASWTGRVGVGWLIDRYFAPHVAAGTFLLGALGSILIYYDGAGPLGFLGAMLIGVSLGAESDLAMYLVSRYFPLAAYSKAVSISWLAWAWGGGFGSFLFAQTYNVTQSFGAALWIIMALFVLASILSLTMPPYREKPHEPA